MERDSLIVLSSDSEEGEPVEDVREKVEEVEEDFKEPPEWIPDGWIMEVQRGEDGSFYQYFISPVTGVKFRMKAEVLTYLFSGMEDRFLESKKCASHSTLPSTHLWLPKGWFIEIRAGGEKMDKMFKYFTDPVSHYVFRTLKSAMSYLTTGKITNRSFIQKTSVHDLYNFDKCADMHEFLRRRLTNNWKTDDTPTKLSKSIRSSASTEKENYNDDRFEDGESSTNFGSRKEHQRRNKSRKSKEKEPNSDKIIKRPKKKSSRAAKDKQVNGDTNGKDPESEQEEDKTNKAGCE